MIVILLLLGVVLLVLGCLWGAYLVRRAALQRLEHGGGFLLCRNCGSVVSTTQGVYASFAWCGVCGTLHRRADDGPTWHVVPRSAMSGAG